MGFQRKICLPFLVLFGYLHQVTTYCGNWSFYTFPNAEELVNVSHVTMVGMDSNDTYSLFLLLNWNRPESSIDFDGYVVDAFVIGEQESDYSCELKNTSLYTNETEIQLEIKYNYNYEFQFRLASKELKKKSFITSKLFFSEVDCYQETADRDFCMTLDAQYASAPIDLRVENITWLSSKSTYQIWVSLYPPASINDEATLHSYGLTIEAVNSSVEEELTSNSVIIKEVNQDSTKRRYIKLSRNFTIETSYKLTVVAYANLNTSELKPSVGSSVYFNPRDFLHEETNINPGHKEIITETLSIYYTLVIPVLIGTIVFAIAVISLGFYTRRQKQKDMIPQFKREPDDIFVKSKQDYFEYREVDPLFAKKEFDRDMLKIEDELGSGQFGVVCKGFAYGIDGGNDYIPVAVKSLKGYASRSMKDYFLDEIRLIIDIGNHPNILGLLGCCTTDEPYYLITEFMHYGDLFHFLLKCREAKYALEDPIFHLDYQNQVQIARQISRGMDYLSSTRYYHGDLAARNILVDKGLVIKISDFGLADDIYQSDYKHLAPDRKRPIKWVSLETNLQGICTIQSDVWSFGIVLYEIATLGGMPYPGMQSIEVVERLKEGYRMEQPEKCSNEWYQMMLECWIANPSKRPKFGELFSRLDTMLDDDAVDYLLPLDGDVNPIEILDDDLALGTSAKSYTPVSSEDITTGYEASEVDLTEVNLGKSISTENMSKAIGTDSAFYEEIGYT